MNDRIVVALQSPIVGPPQFYLLEPDTHDAAGQPLQLTLDAVKNLTELAGAPSLDPAQDAMEAFGTALYAQLSAHPAIKDSVLPLLHMNPPQLEPFYLYFQHRMQSIEELPWEALSAPDVGYLAQNRDFSMARMLNTNSTKSEWLFEPPLKIAAVLGAGGDKDERIGGAEQWAKLWKAVNESKLPVRLMVLTCELALRNKINKTGAAAAKQSAGALQVTAHLINDRDELFAQIQQFGPHILHFFCHGAATSKPQLQVASYKDWETDAPGSILIEGEQLKQNADLEGNIWLVILNCCETAKGGPGNSSLSMPVACNLVGGGIPVAVGMRERITGEFANTFCGLFYQSLLTELRLRLEEARKTGCTDVHWACSLFKVRGSLYEKSKADKQWTIPVMHTRLKRFQLKLNPALVNPALVNPVPASPAAGGPAAEPTLPAAASGLSRRDIHEYGQELLQLLEDVKLYDHIGSVVGIVKQRTAEIKQVLKS